MPRVKDAFMAKIAFYLSLGFWIPLFNIALCIVSIYLALKANRLRMQEPKKYDGFYYIVAALVISLTGLILTVVGFVVYYILGGLICELPLA